MTKKVTNDAANKMFYKTGQDHGDALFNLAGAWNIEVAPESEPVYDYTDDEGTDVYKYHVLIHIPHAECSIEATAHSLQFAAWFKELDKTGNIDL